MPIYEYRCDDCDHQFDLLQKISDPPPSVCPQCGAAGVRKLISAAGFRLKGGGWYETDFKSGGQRNLHDSGQKDQKGPKEKPAGEAKAADSGASSPSTATGGAAPAVASQ